MRGSGEPRNSHHGALILVLKHTRPSQAGTKTGLLEREVKETIALMWQEDLQAKPARMDGSEIMRSDGEGGCRLYLQKPSIEALLKARQMSGF